MMYEFGFRFRLIEQKVANLFDILPLDAFYATVPRRGGKGMSMNRRLPFFGVLFLILIMMASCSPIEETAIPKEDVTIAADAASIDMSASNDRRGISLSFKPVSGARSYAISIGGSEEKMQLSPVLENGTYTVYLELPDGTIGQSSSLSLKFYASASLMPDSWTELFTISAPYKRPDINTIAPKADVTERDETKAVITIIDAPESDMQYKVTIDGKDTTSSSSTITITGLDPDRSYTATISHRYKDEASYGTLTTEIRIGQYAAISVDTDEATRDIKVTGIPEGLTTIRLVKLGSQEITIKEESVSGETHIFPASLFTSFDIGTFQVFAEDGKGNTVQSNEFPYYSSVPKISKATTGRQHQIIEFPVSSNVTNLSGTASIGDDVDITIANNTATAVISGLESLTSYEDPTIKITSGLASVDIQLETFTTESFAGRYEFLDTAADPNKKQMGKFAVSVEFNENYPESSDYKYYISSDEGTGTHRIMPLIDPKQDKDVPNPVPYDSKDENTVYQLAYQWNNKKWNTSPFDPSTWFIKETDNIEEVFITVVSSKAIGVEVETTTRFEFMENEDFVPYVVFYNKITFPKSGFLDYNSFLNKNRICIDQGFLDKEDGPYTFRLDYKGANQ